MSSPRFSYAGRAIECSEAGQEYLGSVRVESRSVIFDSDGLSLEFSIETLVIERGEGKQIVLSDLAQPDWAIVLPGLAILDHPIFGRRANLRVQARKIHELEASNQRLRLTAVALVLLAMGGIILFGLGKWTTGFLITKVPPAWEQQLGDSVYEEISAHVRVVERPELSARLDIVADQLKTGLPRTPYRFQFHIVDNPVPNAFALPGGRIFVHTGLFEMTERPEELAGVLAHEMAHVTERHGIRHIVSTVGPYLLLSAFMRERDGFLALIREGSGFLIQQHYSREYEKEADERAWQLLVRANIDPRGLADFLRKLMADPELARLDSQSVRAFRSHPPTPERIEHLDKNWNKLHRKTGFVEWSAGHQ